MHGHASVHAVSAAAVFAVLATAAAHAARPRYGGMIRIETDGVMRSVDPAIEPADGSERALAARVMPSIFESLVAADGARGLRPVLAVAWEHDDRNVRWRFRLRPGVRFHDGSVLQPPQVAAIIGAQQRSWRVGSSGDAVVIETDRAHPDLPWELADARFAIAGRTATGDLFGTGPFRIDRFDSRRLMLRAFDDHWAGRPFADTVQIELGRPLSDQLSSVELGRADLVAIRAADAGRAAQHRLRPVHSAPIELVALLFEPHRSGPQDDALRQLVARSIDRTAMATILLQRQAEPAAGLLPSWLSGYAPIFLSEPHAPAAAGPALTGERRSLTLRVDAADTVAQDIAARVAVDLRAAGVTMTVQTPAGLAPRPDARLIRIRLEPASPPRVLSAALSRSGPRLSGALDGGQMPASGAPLESVLAFERAVVERAVVVPLVHLRDVYALGDRVDSWNAPAVLASGGWNLANMWVRSEP
jgi:MarR-like DNA-binding transcriptional regulator SgrR of sgrS sRNA